MRLVTLTLALALLLPACSMLNLGDSAPTTVPRVARERSVDPAEAIRLINAHRARRGRAPLVVDPRLNRIAADTASELARRDQLRTELHTRDGLARRLEKANYEVDRSAENLGAGYPTLVTAVDGWKASRRHNRNLLNPDMTHAGIGLALTDQGDFKSYWVLVLARPSAPAS